MATTQCALALLSALRASVTSTVALEAPAARAATTFAFAAATMPSSPRIWLAATMDWDQSECPGCLARDERPSQVRPGPSYFLRGKDSSWSSRQLERLPLSWHPCFWTAFSKSKRAFQRSKCLSRAGLAA